jgi:hypothetical protein
VERGETQEQDTFKFIKLVQGNPCLGPITKITCFSSAAGWIFRAGWEKIYILYL